MADEKTATPTKSNKGLIAGICAAVAAVIIIVVCVLVFNKPSIVGKYNLTAFIENGEETTEMVDLLKAFGGTYTIEFKNDKTGVLEMKAGDESQSVNFKYTDKKITLEQDGEKEETDYTFKDKTVTVTVNGQGMKFEREEKK